MSTQIIFSDEFNKHDISNHPENADRLYVMLDALEQTPFYKKLQFIEPKMIPEKLLYEIHSEEMIQRIAHQVEQRCRDVDAVAFQKLKPKS